MHWAGFACAAAFAGAGSLRLFLKDCNVISK